MVQGFSLGANVDREADGQPELLALGDDNNPVIADDEDGVTFPSTLVAGQSATVRVTCTIPAGTVRTAFLDGWIDFNGNESWGDAGEQVFVSVPLVAGVNLLIFDVPASARPGATFGRFRLSAKGRLAPGGLADNGEVEDHRVSIESAPRPLDFGDAPSPYPTLLANDGARHVYDQAYQLGPSIDFETDGQPSATALGDDATAGGKIGRAHV